jgi:hypothetical protein
LTHPSSRAFKQSSRIRKIAPTLPPGFLGVECGDPTVPNAKGSVLTSNLILSMSMDPILEFIPQRGTDD